MTSKHILALLGFRFLNAFIIQTFYVPDEYWQSLEVAHHAVFGYGHLTWEWDKRIRSCFHPLVFALPFSFLRFFGLDSRAAVIAVPKLVQACLSALGDFFFFRLVKRVVGVEAAKWATFAYLTNHFALFSLPRTLSNSLETILSVIALSYFPFCHADDENEEAEAHTDGEDRENVGILKHLSLAALTVVVRPTAVITWIPLWLPKLVSRKIQTEEKKRFFTQLIGVTGVAILVSTTLDSIYYGQFTFVPWEFLKWNVLEGVASFYGSHPFHWYFTQGFPVILGPHLFPFLAALHLVWKEKFSSGVDQALQQYRDLQKRKEQKQKSKQDKQKKEAKHVEDMVVQRPNNDILLVKMIFWILFIYSFLGHKEFRFIFTTLPFAMCLVGKYYASIESTPTFGRPVKKAVMIGVITLLNLASFFYLAVFHQRGNLDVVRDLADRLDRMNQSQRDDSFVLFLLPCHQHPYYSHLHHNVAMRFLQCEPHFAVESALSPDSYVDEADRFFSQPEIWLQNFLSSRLPSHVILSRRTEKQLTPLLRTVGLERNQTFFHSHFQMDSRMGTELLLFSKAD